ncbi:MAG: LCP family protein [Dermatophilaceae bacterium]
MARNPFEGRGQPGPSADDGDLFDVRRPARARRGMLADPDSLTPRLRRRRAFTLVGMTWLVPGLAQLVAGRRRLGRWGVRIWGATILVVVLGAMLWLWRRAWLFTITAHSWVLMALAFLCAVLAATWVVMFIDAARLGRLRGLPNSTRRGVAALTVVGMLATAGPLTWASSALYAGSSVLNRIFSSGVSKPPSGGRYNILLLGGDSGADRIGTRPDTVILASIDAANGETVTFGFARDTENINFRPGSTMARLMPDGWNCGDECLLNGLYTWATDNKDRFPHDVQDPGALATVEAVEALSGLDIQYYALIDLQGFQTMVDAVGGLDVIVKKPTPVGGGSSPVYEYIQPGEQHLNGFYALWYARSREGATNYERMARQKCVLGAAMKQLDPQTVLVKFRDLAVAGEQVLHTDIPQADLGALADLALKSRGKPMTSVNFVPPLIDPWNYDPADIRDRVAQAIDSSTSSRANTPAVTPKSQTPSAGDSGQAGTAAPTGSSAERAGGGTQDTSRGEESSESLTGDGSDICVVP